MNDQGYYRYPTIHSDTIVFCCEDDLWTVPAGGGSAHRLTAGIGECSMPRLSRDGRFVAYVGREEGHPEVYVMSAAGGHIRRLTYMGGEVCLLSGWTPNGQEILFTTDAGSPFLRHTEAYAVNMEGGEWRRLPLGHLQTLDIHESGATVIGRNAIDPARWKRYRGGTAGELWVDAAGQGEFVPLIALPGNLVCPMWAAGRVYFLSDHEGVANIYSVDPGGKDIRQHTHETEYFARYPSTDGHRIVYTAGARIKVLDLDTDHCRTVDVSAPPTTVQAERKFVEASKGLEHFAPHPQGHSLAFISRGRPVSMPFWEAAPAEYGAGSKVRYRLCEWLPDGERFVCVNDLAGFERIEVHCTDPGKEPLPVTTGDIGRVVELAVSPSADMIAVSNHRYEVLLIDMNAREARVLDRSPADRITGLAWSPDGRWLAYSWPPHQSMAVIRIADVADDTIHDVTDAVRSDRAPFFDPDGNYLYFLSNRDFNPVYDAVQFHLSFPQATRPFLVTLRKDVPSPFVPEPRAVSGKNGEENEKGKKDVPPPSVQIDFDGIQGRILSFPVDEGRYEQLVAAPGRVLFTLFPVRGIRRGHQWWQDEQETGTLLAYDFKENRLAPLHKDVGTVRIAADHRTLIYRSGNKLRVVDALEKLPSEGEERKAPDEPGRKSGWIDTDRVRVLIQPRDEWAQMFRESWRLQGEHFWDERMSEVDWKLVLDRYAALVPLVRTRSELSDLIWEMQGELGTSHAYEMGGDYRPPREYHQGFLGADLSFDEASGGYRIDKILRGDSWDSECDSPLARPGLRIEEGDIILSVGGRPVSRYCPVAQLLLNAAGKDVLITILDGKGERRTVAVTTLKDERWLRYRRWVEHNRTLVYERSGGRLGYVHVPDMGPWGFAEFHRSYLAEVNREGLVVDVRYNRGGHVSPLLLEKLMRKRVGYDVSRWGTPQPYPPESVAGPIVAVTNQFAGSDGDIFSHCFKLYKLGPLVGKRTWGGVIGIWPRHRLVDGTVTTQPEFSFWFVDVGWSVENYGTDPDYEIDIAPQDYRDGRDPQLDKAIALALDSLKKQPAELPSFEARPSLKLPSLDKTAAASGKRRS